MVNEFVYCPRLAYLMWGQAEWAETGDTVDGRRVHTRVDRANKPLPDPEVLEADDTKIVSRSLTLSSEKLGVIAKIDIAEAEDGVVTPVDYKRGKRPHVAKGAYEPERIQVCLQALLLEEHAYQVEEGAIWYAESRERVRIVLDEELRLAAREAVSRLRLTVAHERIPPPLKDSPKCPRCALVSICLPDEMRSLGGSNLAPRPIAVGADEALPLIVQSQRARITKAGETLKVADEEQGDTTVRLNDISDLALFGNVSITTPALATLMDREIPVAFHSHGGWFRGVAHGVGHRNVEVRTAQYKRSFDAPYCMGFARDLVEAKIVNQRTMIRRNWRGDRERRKGVLDSLNAARRSTKVASSKSILLGVEGDSAATYFRAFAELLAPPGTEESAQDSEGLAPFRFDARNRRPPTDPVNAMLSLGYAMLTRHCTVALATVGLDPYRGFFHAPRYGKPALALDIMEPFRPIIADSVVLSAVNTGEVSPGDFVSAPTGTSLTPTGRRRFVAAFERRLSQETTHPLFGYRLSMRRLVLLQARLLCRHLLGELPSYPHYLPR
ncbi:MAG: CRISPR-associated endonuclease Cas1 [Gammaproteobacteria bacterium]|nr:CRISPR-associated endonuclease Cas1 [Gammaproteobacteria bacterium]MYF58632.1 CRISPR-associated endonuclease Cas1 [Gammaproteobacteria bacterium]MYF69174.1 CRISPR-associated endonuclease Cas1 [Pseudomonadota bacterium]MYJ96328.1 CRISPR-associated endonuclease Cas1 [Pseudomonadota bacterium]